MVTMTHNIHGFSFQLARLLWEGQAAVRKLQCNVSLTPLAMQELYEMTGSAFSREGECRVRSFSER